MQIFKKLIIILTPQEYKSALFLLLMILIMALIDIAGIASILPFVAILTNPTLIESNMILKSIFELLRPFGVENNQQFIFVFGVFVFILLIASLSIKSFTLYLQIKFVQMQEYSISKRLVEGYLQQPYSWFLNHHSADLGKSILSEASNVVINAIKPMLELIAKSTITIVIIILLSFVDPKLTLIVFFTLGSVYAIALKFTKNFLFRIGEERLKANQLKFLSVSEAFAASKEIKLGKLEQIYINKFSQAAQNVANYQIYSQTISQLPRYIFETLAFGGILLVILYLVSQTGSFISSLPILSLYIFAGYRLLPAIQGIYSSITQLRFAGPAIDSVYDDLKSFKKLNLDEDLDGVTLKKNINLKNVYYQYPGNSQPTLKDININILANSIVGFVGTTGSGKTTTADIILGLLEPQKGTLEIDGRVITKKNFRTWQKLIGYVPQHIYLSDDSISANIAFGVDPKNIDQNSVENAAKIANIHEFITKELPKKYQTTIGERGIRLSGGQRQRLGVARALYNKPKVLVLDEATSALDNGTEKAVMEEIYKLSLKNSITIILIAHRLSTLEKCKTIFKFDGGKLQKN